MKYIASINLVSSGPIGEAAVSVHGVFYPDGAMKTNELTGKFKVENASVLGRKFSFTDTYWPISFTDGRIGVDINEKYGIFYVKGNLEIGMQDTHINTDSVDVILNAKFTPASLITSMLFRQFLEDGVVKADIHAHLIRSDHVIVDPDPDPDPTYTPFGEYRPIEGFDFNYRGIITAAAGSDNFASAEVYRFKPPVYYTAWGDGNGFTGRRRSEIGISRVVGEFGNHKYVDDVRLRGKCYGLIVRKGRVYAFIGRESANFGGSTWDACKQSWLYEFTINSDQSLTQVKRTLMWKWTDRITVPYFLQIDPGYFGEWVYGYAPWPTKAKWEIWETDPLSKGDKDKYHVGNDRGIVWMFKVQLKNIHNRGAYLWYAGDYRIGNEKWGTEAKKMPCIVPNKTLVSAVCFVPGYHNTFLFTSMFSDMCKADQNSHLQIWQAPRPWGKWEVAGLFPRWGAKDGVLPGAFYWNFATAWFTDDGRKGNLIFTGINELDRFNVVPVTFR